MNRLVAGIACTALIGCGSMGARAGARHAPDPTAAETELASLRAELESQNQELRTVRGQLALARAEAQELRAQVEPWSGGSSQDGPTPGDSATLPWLAEPVTVPTGEGEREVLSVFEDERLATTSDVPELPAFIEEETLIAASGPDAGVSIVDAGVQDYRRGLDLIREQRFDEASTALSAFLDVYPDHPYADNALFWRGEIRFIKHDYARALVDFRAIEKQHPWGNKLPDALYRIGQIYLKRGDKVRARAYFERVREQFPDTAAARLALREDAS